MNKPNSSSMDELYFEVTEKTWTLKLVDLLYSWSWLLICFPHIKKKYLLVEDIETEVWYMLYLSFSKSFLVSLDGIFLILCDNLKVSLNPSRQSFEDLEAFCIIFYLILNVQNHSPFEYMLPWCPQGNWSIKYFIGL